MIYRLAPLQPWPRFVRRSFDHLLLGSGIVFCALGLGIFGYHFIAGFPWIDALLNASMIPTGMGPVGELKTTGAKLFASIYALFSALLFLVGASVVIAPLFHRLLHKLHLETQDQSRDSEN